MEKFDAIIVGGGLAGLAAGFCLANAGVNTLLVERGNFCGGKNVSGGRLYGHSMETLIPGFAGEAPIERKIVSERLALLTKDGGLITAQTIWKIHLRIPLSAAVSTAGWPERQKKPDAR